MARLELAASWSQTRRPTNWATPGYEVEFFAVVVKYVVKGILPHFQETFKSGDWGKLGRNRGVHNISGSRTGLVFQLPNNWWNFFLTLSTPFWHLLFRKRYSLELSSPLSSCTPNPVMVKYVVKPRFYDRTGAMLTLQ